MECGEQVSLGYGSNEAREWKWWSSVQGILASYRCHCMLRLEGTRNSDAHFFFELELIVDINNYKSYHKNKTTLPHIYCYWWKNCASWSRECRSLSLPIGQALRCLKPRQAPCKSWTGRRLWMKMIASYHTPRLLKFCNRWAFHPYYLWLAP